MIAQGAMAFNSSCLAIADPDRVPQILVTLKSNGRHPAESADLLPEHRTVGTLALPEESDIFSEQFGV
jgi:hypothetical protein